MSIFGIHSFQVRKRSQSQTGLLRLAFPRLGKIRTKSQGHRGASAYPGKGLLALGKSIPFQTLTWSREHQNLLNQRLPLSRHCKKGHNSNPSNKSILFLGNTEELKGWGRERRQRGISPNRSPYSPPCKGLLCPGQTHDMPKPIC